MSDFDNEKSAPGALLGHTICTLIGGIVGFVLAFTLRHVRLKLQLNG